jgi:hypothetical protein
MLIRATVSVLMLAFGAGQPCVAKAEATINQTRTEEIARFADLLQFRPLLDVIAQEGIVNADDINVGLLNNEGGGAWEAEISRLYDPKRMFDQIVDLLHAELGQDPETLTSSTVFFASAAGQKVLSLEIEARRALLADGAEAAAEAGYYGMVANTSPRVDALARLVVANDLIEFNVMTALNSNFAFLKGMASVSSEVGLNEPEMLAQVWAGEADAREQTEIWIFPYLALAYAPMSDAELESYITFSNSEAGQKLNAAIFRAFDAFMVGMSAKLGQKVGTLMIGQDI